MRVSQQPGGAGDDTLTTLAQTWLRPSGLGTSAAVLPRLPTGGCTGLQPPAGPVSRGPGSAALCDWSAYALRPWGDGSASPLYCPRTERIDDALGAEVDARLIAWAAGCGCGPEELAALGKVRFGRLVMLTHADVDDPDAL